MRTTTEENYTDGSKRTLTVIKATGFAHWASYLINGDRSGLDYYSTPDDPNAGDREVAAADAFQAWIGGRIVDVEGETFFDRPDGQTGQGRLYGDCLTYVALAGEGV